MHSLFTFLTIWLLPLTAYAQAGLDSVGSSGWTGMWGPVCAYLPYSCGAISTSDEGVFVITGIIIKTVLWIVGGGAILVILYAAARMVSSGGSDEVVTKSKKVILYAGIGLLLIILANAIITFIQWFMTNIALL